MSEKEEYFADDFETGEEVEVAEAPAKKAKKKAASATLLTVEQCVSEETHKAYLGYLTSVVPAILSLDLSKKYTPEEVWEKMNETGRKTANSSFKKKGRFGEGGGKTAVPKTPAEEKAFGLIKEIRDGMIAYVEANHMDSFQTLQDMNSSADLSIEIYFKGFKKFKAGLPTG